MRILIATTIFAVIMGCDITNPNVNLKKSKEARVNPGTPVEGQIEAGNEANTDEQSPEIITEEMLEEQMRGRYESALGYDLRLRREQIEPGMESRSVFGFQGLLDRLEQSFENPVPEMIQNARSTFEISEERLSSRTNFGAVAFNILHRSAKQMCDQMLADNASFTVEPNNDNASLYCNNWSERFWNRKATEEELKLCVETAVVTTASAETALERWSGTCAVLVSSSQFYSFEI